MAKMKKWMLIRPYKDSPIQIWEFIDDLQEALQYWYVARAISKYGINKVMPIVMNDLGGYHTHRPDAPDVVAIIESVEKPGISVFKQYPVNSENFRTGWLSPDCTSFSCEYMGHIGLAMRIVKEFFGLPENPTADDALLEKGWIKVMNRTWLGEWDKINDKQMAFLEEKGFKCHIGKGDV